jgi:two-component system phosphate regulon sensor histidine kinase PhoR
MNPTKRIGLILTVIFLIPALFFSVYEISSLNEDEEIIEEIYQRQLETILFSVNQYSDDALSSWISKTQSYFDAGNDSVRNASLENLLLLNSPIHTIFVVDTMEGHSITHVYTLDSTARESIPSSLEKNLSSNQTEIRQLVKYKKSGFQKLGSIESTDSIFTNRQIVIFITDYVTSMYRVAGFVLDPEAFIEDYVGPRLQSIAKDQFILSVYRESTKSLVYSTLSGDSTSMASLTKDVWIFPDYAIGIRTMGPSLQHLVQERTRTNLYLLIGLDVILIIAVILAFRSIKREVQLAQNKSDFVSNVSHEIRTPLALISMFAETLQLDRVKSEEKKHEYYEIINKETQRLTGIVNKILTFSQTEAGKKNLHIEPLDLTAQLMEVLKTYDFHLKNKGFVCTQHVQNGIRVSADKEAVTEIIINLLDNAIKYSPSRKEINITTGQDQRMGWMAIRDHGIGISRHDQKHIFDKFYRVSSGDLAKSPGTGIGLSLVKQLVEKQNGIISVKSEQGEGTIFTIYFPIAK